MTMASEGARLAAAELGLAPIHVASLEGDVEAVVKIACEPGVIDTPTRPPAETGWRHPETPIKLAALMGHLRVVEFLLERGASLGDSDLHASFYALEDGVAAQRRHFFLDVAHVGREHPDAARTRRAVHDLLASPGRRSAYRALLDGGEWADLGFPEYKLGKQGRDIVVYAPVLRVRTGAGIPISRNKTIGVIVARGGQGHVLMAAQSGFRLGGAGRDGEKNQCLNTGKWNHIVLTRVASVLGFQFPGNRHDNGGRPAEEEHRGRAHAGHVEILLSSWYALELVKKHGIVAADADNGNGIHNEDADGGASHLESEEDLLDRQLAALRSLRRVTLGDARWAQIRIDSQPCATCLRFVNALCQRTGLAISIVGGTGVGPTLATKNARNNVRLDTFGDVFPASELESDEEGGDGQDRAMVREVLPPFPLPPSTPEPDPFSNMESRRSENHLELLARYNKKTPVFEFPQNGAGSRVTETVVPMTPLPKRQYTNDSDQVMIDNGRDVQSEAEWPLIDPTGISTEEDEDGYSLISWGTPSQDSIGYDSMFERSPPSSPMIRDRTRSRQSSGTVTFSPKAPLLDLETESFSSGRFERIVPGEENGTHSASFANDYTEMDTGDRNTTITGSSDPDNGPDANVLGARSMYFASPSPNPGPLPRPRVASSRSPAPLTPGRYGAFSPCPRAGSDDDGDVVLVDTDRYHRAAEAARRARDARAAAAAAESRDVSRERADILKEEGGEEETAKEVEEERPGVQTGRARLQQWRYRPPPPPPLPLRIVRYYPVRLHPRDHGCGSAPPHSRVETHTYYPGRGQPSRDNVPFLVRRHVREG